MKDFLAKFMCTLAIAFMIVGCGNTRRAQMGGDYEFGTAMTGVVYYYDARQVDSMCVVDHLKNIDDWMVMSFSDYETGERIVKRMYIKQVDGETQIRYTLIPRESVYKISKITVRDE